MDKDFTWNQVQPDEGLIWGSEKQGEIEQIKSRIAELKAEREQLVAQLGDDYSDERIGAAMLRAGDNGAMYQNLRGLRNNREMAMLNNAKNGESAKPTQEDVDKLLETYYATAASINPESKDEQKQRAYKLLGVYESKLMELKAKNPDLNLRDFVGNTGNNVTGNSDGAPKGGELNKFKYWLYENGNLTDSEIDAEAKKLASENKDYAEEIQQAADAAKKRSQTAYQEYTGNIAMKRTLIDNLYTIYQTTSDIEQKKKLSTAIQNLGGSIKSDGELKKPSAMSKDKWLKSRGGN